MATKKKKLQITVVDIPTSLEAVNDSIVVIARDQAKMDKIKARYEEKVRKLQEEMKEKITPLSEAVEISFTGIYAYCEANRPELTEDGKKTIELPAGAINWRFNPPSIVTKSGLKVADVVKILKSAKLKKFVRTKEEVDKEAILKNPDTIKNIPEINIRQEETFNVKPKELQVEITEKSANLKKLLPKG